MKHNKEANMPDDDETGDPTVPPELLELHLELEEKGMVASDLARLKQED